MKKFALILLVLIPLLWASFASPPNAFAATITVNTLTDEPLGDPDNGNCSIREAFQAANTDTLVDGCTAGSGADVINFSVSGTIDLSVSLDGEINIISQILLDGGSNITFDGNNATRIFNVNSSGIFTLQNTTLTQGNGNSGSGGAITVANGGSLTVNAVEFSNNNADTNGGAIDSSGTLSIQNSVFQSNSAQRDGGAIYQSSNFSMTIENTAFIDNSAGNDSGYVDGSGGAIYHNGAFSAPSSITAAYFFNNQVQNATSADGGGAIYHGNLGVLAITASAFFGNTVTGDDARGGAIYNNSGDDFALTINYSHFGELFNLPIPPIPPILGFDVLAAIGANGAGNSVTGASDATAGGGAIFNNGYLLMNGVSLIANSSSNHGGAFMNTRTTPDPFPQPLGQQVIISNSTFANNTANANGGAIFHGNSSIPNDNLMEIRNVTIANNTAASGDGIFNLGDGESPGFSNFDDFYLVNTIIANDNCAGGSLGNGNASASGNNVVFNSTCDIRQQDGSSTLATPITTDPVLSTPELAFNLANIFTVVLSLGPSSSASGTGDNGVCTSFPVLSLDQRNLPLGFRPQGAPNCDIGAYESDQVAPPEIEVRDSTNITVILDGDATPDGGDGTDYGTTPVGTPVVRSFIINNLGGANLTLGAVTVPAGFTISTTPSSPVAGGANTTLGVTCDATVAGTYSGDIVIPNNDSDENPYNFAITCLVEGPEITVTGLGGNNVANGSAASLVNGSDFDTIAQGSPLTRTFTIENTGVNLNLDVTSIAFVGTGTGFSITPPILPDSIAPTNTITFDVTCLATSAGLFTETITIANNDSNENPFTFAIRCDVTATEPELEVRGNSVIIVNGDATPDLSDDTDFGTTLTGTPISRTFTIRNIGAAQLTTSGSVVSGTGFTITTFPAGTVDPNDSTTLVVQCTASTAGTYIETVSFANNDSDENPFSFNIRCQVNDPEPDISILGNATVITPGDVTPDLADHTQFVTTVVGVPVLRTFTIENNGTANLNISTATISNSPNPFLFVTSPALESIAPGGSFNFVVQCQSATDGSFTETVSIQSDDPDTPAYSFNVGCTVNDEPEINVYGNSVLITNGDVTPSLLDDTDFGTTLFGTPVTRQFIIENIGSQVLTITGAVTVTNPTNFSVTLQPAATLPPPLIGNDTIFEVTCSAANLGTHTATVSIPNDDSDENPFTFEVSCTVNSPSPIIEVYGNSTLIVDGVIAPDLADHTLFPTTSPGVPVSRTFEIRNTGTGSLTVSISTVFGVPFTLTTPPTSPVTNGNPTTFTIECNPPANGNYPLTITIDNNDSTTPGANPYTFGIECVATTAGVPEINVRGNGTSITSGDATPDLADHTDFGNTSVGIPIVRTFTIENTGLGDLTLGAVTVPAGFTVTTAPAGTVTGGNSTTLGITCDATAQSTYSGTVSIVNDDSDENPYEFAIRCVVNPAGTNADLSLSKIVSDTTPQFGDIITYTVTVNNVGPGATTGVQVVDTFPTSVTFLAVGTVSQGTVTVDGSNLFLTWDIGTMVNPQTVTLTYTVQVNPTVGTTNNYAEITASTAPDPNSTPGNGIPPNPIEDDEAAIAFLFDPPFGSKAFIYDGVSVVTWTIIWVNPSNNPIPVEMSDPLLGGTTFLAGSLSCTTPGTTTITTCLHNAVTNTIEFTGIIDPNPGATIGDVNTASNRLIITYSVIVPDGVDSVANTATLTDLDSDVTSVVTETFTRTITPPPTSGGGTPPLTAEQINAKVTALPATGETPLWADLLRIGLLMGVALIGAGAMWLAWRRRVNV